MFGSPIRPIALLILAISSVVAGPTPAVGTHDKNGDEPTKPTASIPRVTLQPCPGDSIGFTFYDFETGGGAHRNLINFGDGQLSMARMAAVDNIAAGTTTRGSYFKFFDGTSWSPGWERVETVRRGWTNIDQIADAGGVEVVLTHVTEINLDSARGADDWSSTILPCAEGTWPRLAIGSGSTIHVIGTSFPSVVGYHVSQDAGATWSCDMVLYSHPGVSIDADGYDITAKGDKVAFVIAGGGGDVDVLESLDGGATWTENVIYDIDETLMTPDEEVPDGSCSILYDSNGILHVAWGNWLSAGDGATLLYSVDAGIRHWSSGTGVVEAAFPDPDTTIIPPVGRDGNLATQPDLSADTYGNIYIVFSRFINETDVNNNYYEHVFDVCSFDGGSTWTLPTDRTPGTGFDASFPSVADLADRFSLDIIYNCDPYAGNTLQGTPGHPNVAVAIMYLKTFITDVEPATGVLSREYRLDQNYPNPFNPSTEITFDLPVESPVVLSIHNVLGQEVDRLVDTSLRTGTHTVSWDATNSDGKRLASGIYFYRLHATGGRSKEFSTVRKMMLIR